ncbi:MAG: UxaA family hydrolase [Verrucomicrobia bacterium]|nr:UxaA family hydrolase [Verrucomicrobiota bacterium]
MKDPDPTDPRLLRLSPEDNVFAAARPIEAGETILIASQRATVTERIPTGFKVAARAIRAGGKILKWGAPIGSATRDIAAGEIVHVHNMKSDYLPTYTFEEGHSYVRH